MSLTYGYDPKGEDDDMISAPGRVSEIMSRLLLPGGIPCGLLCCHNCSNTSQSFSVKYIPSWVPWLSYEPVAQNVRRLSEKMKIDPINFVKNAMVRCHCTPSIHVD